MHSQLFINVEIVEFSLGDWAPGYSQQLVSYRSGIPVEQNVYELYA